MRAHFMLLLSAVTAAVAAVPASAQAVPQTAVQPADPASAGVLAGRVLDARTGEPVAHALVTLELVDGILPVTGGEVARFRSQLTGGSGAYRFPGVGPGIYRLRIERLGYRATGVAVDVRRPTDADVSIALDFEPVLLEPVRVEQRAYSLFARAADRTTSPAADDVARVAVERVRQDLFVTPDSRVLTWNDVVDGVTLAEGDVFRALQRFPGVGTRDDYSAELWSRGAPWPHSRVTFDGVPILNPLHAVGVLSAVAPDVLGAVYFHPGVRPPALAGSAAAVVDLRTRAGTGTGTLHGAADVSLASTKLVLEQRLPDRAAWVLAARRSHLGLLRGSLGSVGLDTVDLPFVFHDVAGRADLRLGRGAQLEVSGLWEQDRLEGDVSGVLEHTTARWGNAAGRATLRMELRGLELSQTVGASRFSVRTDAHAVRTRDPARGWSEPPSRNEIRHTIVGGELSQATRGGPAPWSVGYDIAWKRIDYDGPLPRTHAVRPDTMHTMTYDGELRVIGVHADARIRAAAGRIALNPGVRVEAVGSGDGTELRPAPRLAVRFALSPQQSISFAAGRSWQHMQALGLAGPSVHPAFHASHFWIVADARTPPLRSDLVSIGTERWLGVGWLAGGTVFVRHATGMVVPQPEPGRLDGRPVFVTADNDARGLELSARRIGARWSASVGYTRGESMLEANGRRYPSPADRREIVDAMAALRLPLGFRAAAAFTAMSGAPFTRAYARLVADCHDFGFGCDNPNGSWVDAPNGERTPAYRSLDTALHWTKRMGRADVATYVQIRNVLGRDNASTYAGSAPIGRSRTLDGSEVIWDDRFEAGLPRLPLAGVRVSF